MDIECRCNGALARIAAGLLLILPSSAVGVQQGEADGERGDGRGEARDGFLTGAAGADLYYRVIGEGSDPVVVVHGGPGAGMSSVRPDFEPLADDLTLIFYDQRGGGRSTLPADTTLLHARYFVEDLESVRAHFGLERMKLLAHSFGAILVARYAQEHPERIDRIVLHGATGPVRSEAARVARAAPPSPDTALSRRASELLGSLLDGTAAEPAKTCREWEAIGRRLAEARGEAARWKGSSCDAPQDAVGYYFRYTAQLAPRTFGDWDFTQGLEDVTAPVLVVYANHDSLAVEDQRAWAASFPNARLLLVPGTDKGAIAQQPEIVRTAITEFLTDRSEAESPHEAGVASRPLPRGRHPSWSPDGRRIAFESKRKGNWDIFILDVASQEVKRVTSSEAEDRQPAWSPDGSRIAFVSDRDGDPDLYVLGISSGQVRRLAAIEGRELFPAWSPDAAKVDFTLRAGGELKLMTVPADGGSPAPILATTGRDVWPRRSPDGDRMAFFSRRDTDGEDDEIYVLDLPTKQLRRITTRPGHDFAPAWDPEGTRLAFVSVQADDSRYLTVVDAERGNEIGRLAEGYRRVTEPAWSPDGHRLAYAAMTGEDGDYRLYVEPVE